MGQVNHRSADPAGAVSSRSAHHPDLADAPEVLVELLGAIRLEAVAAVEGDRPRVVVEHPERDRSIGDCGIQERLAEPGAVVSGEAVARGELDLAGRVVVSSRRSTGEADDLAVELCHPDLAEPFGEDARPHPRATLRRIRLDDAL